MFSANDKVTISRGNHRGQEATIMGPAEDGQYPVRLAKGGYAVIKDSNLKAPQESTIGEAKLAAEIQTAAQDESDSPAVLNALAKLVSRLSGDMPGLGARISWSVNVSDDH